jgi:hypothetical protein
MMIDLTVLDDLPIDLQYQLKEMLTRKNLTLSEQGRALGIIRDQYARQTKPGARNDLNGTSPRNQGQVRQHRDSSLEKAAAALGMSEFTARHLLEIVEAAEEDPQKNARHVKRMDDENSVDGAYKALKMARADERRAAKKLQKGTVASEGPEVRKGDIWKLGRHYLLCGDSTSKEDIDRLLKGEMVDATITSPPYAAGVDYGEYKDTLENLRAILKTVPALWLEITVPGGFACVAVADLIVGKKAAATKEPCEYPMELEYFPEFKRAGYTLWTQRVLTKPAGSVVFHPIAKGTCRAVPEFEYLWVLKKSGKAITRSSKGSLRGVWECPKEDLVPRNVHPAAMAMFPAVRAIEVHSREGMNIFDPFAGVGTTILAAEQTDRTCFAIEINPVYCSHAIKRWEDETGEQAVLESREDKPSDGVK